MPTTDELKAAIYQHGPITANVFVDSAFQSYAGGIFSECAGNIPGPNHAMLLVGWNDDQGVWIAQNSWGSSWGEAGYMRIPYGCNGIGDGAAYIEYKGSRLGLRPADTRSQRHSPASR
jgi:C1A family cysteine protease